MEIKPKRLVFILPIVTLLLLLLWLTGLFGIWTKGISHIADNTNDFNINKSHSVQGEHSLSIDLSNLESNIGKDLFNDGTHRIYVSSVNNTGSINSGGYMINFRSSGRYSTNHATLVSGIQHTRINGNSFTSIRKAKMKAEYNGKVYDSSVSSISGLNYKDGDEFGYYIFPSKSYETNKISFDEGGVLVLTVTNLYKNIWSKN